MIYILGSNVAAVPLPRVQGESASDPLAAAALCNIYS